MKDKSRSRFIDAPSVDFSELDGMRDGEPVRQPDAHGSSPSVQPSADPPDIQAGMGDEYYPGYLPSAPW